MWKSKSSKVLLPTVLFISPDSHAERYSAGIKGDERLLENNQFTKGFVSTGAFRDVCNDIISVSQVLTMSSLNDMVSFMTKNGDLDDQVVKSGLPRLRK